MDPQDLRERVVGALGAVLAVALVIGVVAGAVAYGAVRAAGLHGDEAASVGSTAASMPSDQASPRAPEPPTARSEKHQASDKPKADPGPKHKTRHHRHPRRKAKSPRNGHLTLTTSREHAAPMGRVNLWGHYPGQEGVRLVVQRREGGRWERFPVTVTLRGGSFQTWVASGRRGPNLFRVLDPATGRASASVSVSVG
jgi:hypothetical protein